MTDLPDNAPKPDWRIEEYADIVKNAVDDFIIEPFELTQVRRQRIRMGVSPEQVRAAHAKVFASLIAQFTNDDFLDDDEAEKIKRLWEALDVLGWAPGQKEVRSE